MHPKKTIFVKSPITLNSFLSLVAQDTFEYYNQSLSDVLFVLPNRRSSAMFKQALVACIDKPLWTPEIISIDDWIKKSSSFEMADELECLITLFQALQKEWPSIGSFKDFLFWGNILIRDFETLDKYLVPYTKIYRQISDEKEIESRFSVLDSDEIELIRRFWNSFSNKPSQNQTEWLKLWNALASVVTKYVDQLKSLGKLPASYMYREIADRFSAESGALFEQEVCFIGFNALTKAEEVLFSNAHQSRKGRYYWDAGFLIKSYLKKFPPPQTFVNRLESEENRLKKVKRSNLPPVKLISFESPLAQTKFVCKSLRSDVNTAIVLGSEEFVDELLWSFELDSEDLNVSIGKAVHQTRFGNYISDIVEELVLALGKNADTHPAEDIQKKQSGFESFEGMLDKLEGSAKEFQKNESERIDHFEEAAIELFYEWFAGMRKLIQQYGNQFFIESWLWVFKNWIRSAKVPYPSHPKANILVTGILETRLLDFESVYILSMNEGVWPARNRTSSFIPYHLRKEFGMPVQETLDRMYGYHFFRILQRPAEVQIYYLSQGDNIKSGVGEVSRFIRQLDHFFDVPIQREAIVSPPKLASSGPLRVEKSDQVLQVLDEFTTLSSTPKKLSPSALNTYIDCQIRFFYQYILRIRDSSETEDLSEPRLFGTLLHETMEYIYKTALDKKTIVKSDIEEVLRCENLVEEFVFPVLSISGSFKSVNIEELSARDKLVLAVVGSYISLILRTDLSYAPFSIVGLEKEVVFPITIRTDGEEKTVSLGGYIDRLDSKGSILRVIDYKSGKPKMSFSDFDRLIDSSVSERPKEIFQTLVYSFMLKSNKEFSSWNIIPSLYAMRILEQGILNPQIVMNKEFIDHDELYFKPMEELLQGLVGEIFNPRIPFVATLQRETCKYCSFKAICQRN